MIQVFCLKCHQNQFKHQKSKLKFLASSLHSSFWKKLPKSDADFSMKLNFQLSHWCLPVSGVTHVLDWTGMQTHDLLLDLAERAKGRVWFSMVDDKMDSR